MRTCTQYAHSRISPSGLNETLTSSRTLHRPYRVRHRHAILVNDRLTRRPSATGPHLPGHCALDLHYRDSHHVRNTRDTRPYSAGNMRRISPQYCLLTDVIAKRPYHRADGRNYCFRNGFPRTIRF